MFFKCFAKEIVRISPTVKQTNKSIIVKPSACPRLLKDVNVVSQNTVYNNGKFLDL